MVTRPKRVRKIETIFQNLKKIINTTYYKLPILFLYQVMDSYAWRVNCYILLRYGFTMLWLLPPFYYTTTPPVFFACHNCRFVFPFLNLSHWAVHGSQQFVHPLIHTSASESYSSSANTWHVHGIVHCTSNPRVSSFTPHQVCPGYAGPMAPTILPHMLFAASPLPAAPLVSPVELLFSLSIMFIGLYLLIGWLSYCNI